MSLLEAFDAELSEHAKVVDESRASLGDQFVAMLEAWSRAIRGGGKIMLFGNGGSAADAQHIATELTIRYAHNRPAIAAIALTTDTSALTAAGNDLGFETIFARQLEALGRPGDLVLALSTSGRSPNIIAALRTARQIGVEAAALTGGDGGLLVGLAEPLVIVPSDVTARIQELHITLGHMLCGALERRLGYRSEKDEVLAA
ncbi:MAG TPA: SIS domain-containing protein [Dehalococcoidia bacterium]|nr:SIS domain-containing protein [Dehalococcoidia bacterium]